MDGISAIVFVVFLATIGQWRERRYRRRRQQCAICVEDVVWRGNGWTHADGETYKPYPGLSDIPGLRHHALPGGGPSFRELQP